MGDGGVVVVIFDNSKNESKSRNIAFQLVKREFARSSGRDNICVGPLLVRHPNPNPNRQGRVFEIAGGCWRTKLSVTLTLTQP